MCSKEAGQSLGLTLEFYNRQHLVPTCHIPSRHVLPCIRCLHGLHGHSNLHMGTEILILGSWQSQHAADQRTGPEPHHRPLGGAYIDRKVTTRWPTISFTKRILLKTLSTSKTFFIHSSATNTSTPTVPLSFPDQDSLYLVSLPLIVRQLPQRCLVS